MRDSNSRKWTAAQGTTAHQPTRRRFRPRLGCVSVVAVAAAVGLFGGGTAYAVQAITGADVIDGTLTGADVQDNSLRQADVGTDAVAFDELAFNSVVGNHVQDGTLGGSDIADASLSGTDVADGSLGGADVADGSITGTDVADNSLEAKDMFSGVLYGLAIRTSSGFPVGSLQRVEGYQRCETNEKLIGGGFSTTGALRVEKSFPQQGGAVYGTYVPDAWRVAVYNTTVTSGSVSVYAICARRT